MSKHVFTTLLVLSLLCPALGFSQSMPCPQWQSPLFPYPPVSDPVLSPYPSQAKPIAFGDAATGGQELTLRIALSGFACTYDLYVGIYAPAISPTMFILQPDGSLKPIETGLNPWKSAVSGAIDEHLFGTINTGDLPNGEYDVFLLATDTPLPGAQEDFQDFYLWMSWIYIMH